MWTYQFWRPTIFAAVICIAVVLLCRVMLRIPTQGGFSDIAILSIAHPNSTLSPSDVVRLQVEGMTDREDPGLGALQCYCFAAPSNRLVTGPFEQFAVMVKSPPWDQLSNCDSYSIGKEEIHGDEARVLVTAVGNDRKLSVFTFLLRRHSQEPFTNCWLTVGAFAAGVDAQPAPLLDEDKTVKRSIPALNANPMAGFFRIFI